MAFDLPAQPGPARDAIILDHIRSADYDVSWGTITSDVNGHHGEFRVFTDALKIAGVRITMSAYLAQQVADMLGCSLLTAKIADLIYAQRAVTLLPHTQTPNATMVSTAVMVAQSEWIDGQVAAAGGGGGIIQTVGKHWILDNLFTTNPATAGKAINYGWHLDVPTFQGATWPTSVTLPTVHVVQSRGWAHSAQEVDYSQNTILISRDCVVDGVKRDLWDVFKDPNLASLVNAGGPLSVALVSSSAAQSSSSATLNTLRQPGVPTAPFAGRVPPCVGPSCPNDVTWESPEDAVTRPDPVVLTAGAVALVAVVGGFLGGLALMTPMDQRKKRRAYGR
jgi:hypothetical protein